MEIKYQQLYSTIIINKNVSSNEHVALFLIDGVHFNGELSSGSLLIKLLMEITSRDHFMMIIMPTKTSICDQLQSNGLVAERREDIRIF